MGDLRTTRTYKLLKDALFELLSKQSFDTIRVNDICNLAMVHRTTFYSHFSDKYELLDYAIKDIENEIVTEFDEKEFTDSRAYYTELINHLIKYIGDNKQSFKSMLNNNYSAGIITVFHNSAIKYITEVLEKETSFGRKFDVPVKVMAEYYSGAITATIMSWLTTNSKISEEDMCRYVIALLFDEHK